MSTPNSQNTQMVTLHIDQDTRRADALLLFPLECIQHLDRDSVTRCQQILGHGSVFGVWNTPNTLARHIQKYYRTIDFRSRLISFLSDSLQDRINTACTARGETIDTETAQILVLIDDAVLWMTRYALLCRMGPAGLKKQVKGRPMDVTGIASQLYKYIPPLLAIAFEHRIVDSRVQIGTNFIASLARHDFDKLSNDQRDHALVELKRLRMLQDKQLWTDVPAQPEFKGRTTGVKGPLMPPRSQKKIHQFQPIPDDYIADMGSRVLWIVQDLGPNLIHLYESIPDLFSDTKDGANSAAGVRLRRLALYFQENDWRDRQGNIIKAPPFPLKHGDKRGCNFRGDSYERNVYEWPPHTWHSIKVLAVTLQSAHLWITLLAMAGRQSEVMTLSRDCVEFARDGKYYANGKTYKLSDKLNGEEREWVLPDAATDSLAQQVKLVNAWERITHSGQITEDDETGEVFAIDNTHLWASLGGSSQSDPRQALGRAGSALQMLAIRVSLTPTPGGINLHPHRFRKTIARLCGVAIINSPRLLMQVFGHKDINMTLYYILTDKALAKEVETVTRELRIMRCQEMIEDIRTARNDPNALPYGGHGGPGTRVISEAIDNHENDLYQTGKKWDADSSYDLAIILTANGQNWTLARPHVMCIKGPGEAGLCSKNLGNPDTSNCQSPCTNRIEQKTARRDVQSIIPILIKDWKRAKEYNQLLVMANYSDQLRKELTRFEDIQVQWQIDPDVIHMLADAP